MNELQKQADKLKAVQYLVSKGYKLSIWITSHSNCPLPEVRPFVSTEKIALFTLQDPKQKEMIDHVVCEYGAVPSALERELRRLATGF